MYTYLGEDKGDRGKNNKWYYGGGLHITTSKREKKEVGEVLFKKVTWGGDNEGFYLFWCLFEEYSEALNVHYILIV